MRNLFTTQLLDKIVSKNKVGLSASVSALMPNGIPDFSIIPLAPSIKQLMGGLKIKRQYQYNVPHEKMLTVICLMITDFCDSQNLPEHKNMNESQVIECASFLLDECGNFRIEDYVLMFTLAKRGKLQIGNTGRIFDRVDIQLISDFKVNYEQLRADEAYKLQEKEVKEKEYGTPQAQHNLIGQSEEQKKVNYDEALKQFYDMMKKVKEDKEKEDAERNKRFVETKEKVFNEMLAYAKENGFDGSLIDLSPLQSSAKKSINEFVKNKNK